jgi:hypothetical protein
MPIDPSIALSFKPSVALADPMEMYANYQKMQSNALAMQHARNENALAQRTAQEDAVYNSLQERYGNTIGEPDPERLYSAMRQHGLAHRIPGTQKEIQEAENRSLTNEKLFNANVSSAMDNARFRLEGVRTPEQLMQWTEQNHNDPTLRKYFDRIGVTIEQSRAQIAAVANDPAAFADLRQKAQLGLKNAQAAVNAQANIEIQREYQRMKGGGGGARPAALGGGGSGGARPAASGGGGGGGARPTASGKPLTANEQSAVYNIGRVLMAAKAIKSATGRSPKADAPSAVEAAVGALPFTKNAVNFTRGADRQIVAAAQRDMLDGLLYLATGAAYNKEQLAGQYESYIPTFSDSPEARASKRERLIQLVNLGKVRAGKAWTPELEKTLNDLFGVKTGAVPTAAPAPSAGDVIRYDASGKRM